MSSSAKRPAAAEHSGPPLVVRITLGVILAIVVAMVACTQMASGSGAESSGPAPADVLPAGFPIPHQAEVVDQGAELPEGAPDAGVVTLSVPGGSEAIVDFYRERLPEGGWRTEPWEGTDPYGQAAQGLVINRDGEEGALSVTAGEDGRSTVQINLHQPVSPTEPGMSMSGGGS